jgi:hypothetical protein
MSSNRSSYWSRQSKDEELTLRALKKSNWFRNEVKEPRNGLM